MFSRHQLDPQSGYWNLFSNMEKSFKYAYGSMTKAEEQLSWKPAPKVWSLVGKKDAFVKYVQDEVRGYLETKTK